MNANDWRKEFRAIWDHGVAAWQAGHKTPGTMFTPAQAAWLREIGCTPQELFDFVDDHLRYGEPDFETTHQVTALRRDYFLNVLQGKPTGQIVPMDALPPKTQEVDGIAWLPRLIVKARVKLRGEMPDDLMYGCAGDRPFLQKMNLTLPQFLKLVWDCGDDDRRIIDTVKRCAKLA